MITARQRPDFEALNQRKQLDFLAFFVIQKCETPVSSQHDSVPLTR